MGKHRSNNGNKYEMSSAQKIIIFCLSLYCCFIVFRLSVNAGLFFLPLLFIVPPIIFRKKHEEKDSK
tara:strand:+ start:47 stop:247 length:201 start_codon:yes stop_codon:yes gene_type:complete